MAAASPKGNRILRSGSQTDMLLAEIKGLKITIETSKKEVIETLRMDIENLRQTVNSLTNRVADLEQENNNLNNKLQELSKVPEMLTECIIDECNQRRRRECNLFVFGLPEARCESSKEAETADREMFGEILTTIDAPDVNVKELQRMGRSSGKRPLKVTVESGEQKWKVLRSAAKLRRKSTFSTVYINEDLTPLQQVQRKERLKELKERRNAGEDVVIYRQMVIRRDSIKNLAKNGPARFFNR